MPVTETEVAPTTTRRRRWLFAALAVLVVSSVYVVRIHRGMVDFEVYYRAGHRVWAGEPLYQESDGHYMFKYLPASALIDAPLAALPLDVAKPIWFAISVGAMLWSFSLVQQIAAEPGVRRLWLVPALVLAKYFLRELRLGQINILVMAVLLFGVRALMRRTPRQDIAAGAAAGVAAALKPYSALMVPYLILTGRWRSLAAALGVFAAAMAAPSIFYGVAGNVHELQEWARTLARSTPGELANNDNVSVLALFEKWSGDPARALWLTGIVLGILAIVMLAVVVRGRGRGDGPALEGAMVLALVPLVSPMGWDYNFLLALLAVALLVKHFSSFPAVVQVTLAADFAVIGLVVYDLIGRHAYATFMQWSVTTVNFLIVIAALAWLRFRSVC